MRQLFLSIVIILSSLPLFPSWQVGTDLRCFDSLFMGAARFDAEVSYRWDSIRVSLPLRISCSYSYEMNFAETGLFVSVYPFPEKGFFIAVSMARLGIFWGLEAPREKLMFFSELATGWTFSFPWFFIEPRVTILDAFSSEEGRIAELEKAIPQYSKIRLSLLVGVEIP